MAFGRKPLAAAENHCGNPVNPVQKKYKIESIPLKFQARNLFLVTIIPVLPG